MIGAQEDEHDLRGQRIALFVRAVGGEHDALDAAKKIDAEVFGDEFALFLPGRRALFHRFLGLFAAREDGEGFGEFDVGGVVAFGRVGDEVFARVGDHLEFMRTRTTDRARVGAHGAEHQAETAEDLLIRIEHDVVGARGAGFVAVEGIGVLHREFAAAHDAEAGTAFVAELRLDVIEVHGELTPALDFLTCDVGDDFFGGRLNHEVAAVTVLDSQKFGTVLFPAARFLPELGRLHDWHEELHGARAVHFFANDFLDLADRTKTERHVGVDAGGKFFDHAGPDHELLAHDVGVGGSFFQRGKEKGTRTHDECVAEKKEGPAEAGFLRKMDSVLYQPAGLRVCTSTMLLAWMSSGRSMRPRRWGISSVWQPMMRRASSEE